MPTTVTLKLGDAAPDFSLPGVDGKTYRLDGFASSRVVCVIFIRLRRRPRPWPGRNAPLLLRRDVAPRHGGGCCFEARSAKKSNLGPRACPGGSMCNHCPYVKATIDRIIALQRDYAGKGLQVVGINSNETVNHPEDSLEHMVRWAAEKRFNFPYLRDESQAVARAYGAERTPHIFLFDQGRRLRYTGAVDDHTQDPSKVTRRYLREAIDALLADQPVKEAQTHAIGCSVKYGTFLFSP